MNESYRKIKDDLYNLGVRKGDDILFKYYYEWLPEIEGGFQTLFDALLSAIGDSGTLLISTGTYINVNPDTPAGSPVFDVRNTPSCLDILPNEFLKLPGVERSLHPTHSVAALGARQSEYTRDHWKDNTPAGENSPYRKLFEFGAKHLLSNNAFSMNATMHTIEEYMNVPYVLSDNTRHYVLIDKNGNRTEKDYYYHYIWQRGYSQHFSRLKSLLLPEIKEFFHTKATLIDPTQMWNVSVNALKRDPYFFVHKESPSKTITINSLNSLLQSSSDGKKHEFPMNEQIKKYIEVNFDKEIKLKDIANCFGISLYYMMHQFKKDVGMSIVSYKNYCKLAKATELLMQTNQTIAEISEYCGFYSSSSLSMQFKKEMGISPSEYRKLMRVIAYRDHELFKGTNDKDVILFSQLPHFKLRSGNFLLKNLRTATNITSEPIASSQEYKFPAVIWFKNKLFYAWNTVSEYDSILNIYMSSDSETKLTPINTDCSVDNLSSAYFGTENEKLYLFASKSESSGKIQSLEIFVFNEETSQFLLVYSLNISFKPTANAFPLCNEGFILPGCSSHLGKDSSIPAIIKFRNISQGDWHLVKISETDKLPNGEKQILPHSTISVFRNTMYAITRNSTRKIPLLYQSHDNGETWDDAYSHDIPISEANHCSGTLKDGRSFIIGSLSPTKEKLALFVSKPDSFLFDNGIIILNGSSDRSKSVQYLSSCAYQNNDKLYIIAIESETDYSQKITISTVNIDNLG